MKKRESIGKILLLSAVFLLLFVFFVIFISSVMFIFKKSINNSYIFISLLISIFFEIYIYKNSERISKKTPKKKDYITNLLLPIIIPIIIIVSSIAVSGIIYDFSFDGNAYHKATIGTLADGWNPVYETMEEFDGRIKDSKRIQKDIYVWADHYVRASHVFSANMYKLTGNIEAGKSINYITIGMAILFVFSSIMLLTKKSAVYCMIVSLCAVFSPVVCAQALTSYIDLLVYLYLLLLVLLFIIFEKDTILSDNIKLLLYTMILSITINIKFNVFAYAALYCMCYYIWYIVRIIKNKDNKKLKKFFIKFSVSSLISVIIGIFIIGLSVYPANQIEHGNLFYPIMGKEKIDIMYRNQPKTFYNKSPIERFIIANFSKSKNISIKMEDNPKFKIPFTLDKSELKSLASCDLRIGGYGVFFSGILLLSILLIILNIKCVFKNDKIIFVISAISILITVALAFILKDVWWARYFPQLYFIPLIAILYSNYNKKKYNQIIGIMIIILLLFNNFMILGATSYKSFLFTNEQIAIQKEFERNNTPEKCNLELNTESFQGAFYNVRDKEDDEYSITYSFVKNKNREYQYMIKPYIEWSCKND